ncbi:hypothetical protein DOTSEDRAFT_23185 [Dothistroma septosporum NZE10]|uniref:Uncharacterized protein n=1 Tax=Dothistroma septosporum (strain NZE10 / CBS 128990) TaxID=675120 RepID=N1PNX1_DOTSN|nr:hypothetical protein DOTSEDRAFT_23185 [Dothistroma septosporum NZE10]
MPKKKLQRSENLLERYARISKIVDHYTYMIRDQINSVSLELLYFVALYALPVGILYHGVLRWNLESEFWIHVWLSIIALPYLAFIAYVWAESGFSMDAMVTRWGF